MRTSERGYVGRRDREAVALSFVLLLHPPFSQRVQRLFMERAPQDLEVQSPARFCRRNVYLYALIMCICFPSSLSLFFSHATRKYACSSVTPSESLLYSKHGNHRQLDDSLPGAVKRKLVFYESFRGLEDVQAVRQNRSTKT